MDIEEFKKRRIDGRKQLLEKILDTFKSLKPVAIHQFGSGTKGFKDEFSDIDIWVTFKDSEIEDVLKKLSKIFENIAPVLVRHHSKSWSPVGGSSSSIIHNIESGLFVVDYYISKFSETVIKKDSIVLYGDDSLKRGEWKLNKEVNKDIHDSHTMKKDIDLLLDLIFISVKGVIRKWENEDFIKTLKTVHKLFRERYDKKMKRRIIKLNFKSNLKLLSDLYKISNKRQKRAINKIRKYIKEVDVLYYTI